MNSLMGRETTIYWTYILVEEHKARCSYHLSLCQFFSDFNECAYKSPENCVKIHTLIQ